MLEKIKIRYKQRCINKMFKEEGLTDSLLQKQIEINKIRAEKNIVDDNEVVCIDENGRKFIQ